MDVSHASFMADTHTVTSFSTVVTLWLTFQRSWNTSRLLRSRRKPVYQRNINRALCALKACEQRRAPDAIKKHEPKHTRGTCDYTDS